MQVKGTSRAAWKNSIIVDGAPWTEAQLHGGAPIFNKHKGLMASLVALADLSVRDTPEFYIATPEHLTRLVRRRGKVFAAKPKRDGSKRSIGFRKELYKDALRKFRDRWQLFGPPPSEAKTAGG